VKLTKIVIVAFCASICFIVGGFAQGHNSIAAMDQLSAERLPSSLFQKISIDLEEVPFEQALAAIAKKGNMKFNYNRNRIPVNHPVSVKEENVYAMSALSKILLLTSTTLKVTSTGHMIIVPSGESGFSRGTIKGRVVDEMTKAPLVGTNISIYGMNIGSTSDRQGQFRIDHVPVGKQTLEFSFIGYEQKRIADLHVEGNSEIELIVELKPQVILLKELVVTPSQFSIMGTGPSITKSLTKEDIQTITWGEDIYRAITRLPGIAGNDFTAKFTVRGGEHDEVLVLLDGMELYEPFHLKDIEGGALSIIDVTAVEKIDLFTGGFTAEYGNHQSGVFDIKSTRPPAGRQRTTLGISLMNMHAMSEGTTGDNKISWLCSARRGYIDKVLAIMDEENQPDPTYYDILGKMEYQLNKTHTLSAIVLHADDRLSFIEDDDDLDATKYNSTHSWLTLKSIPRSELFVQTIASFVRQDHSRQGTAYLGSNEIIDFTVADKKAVHIFGLKQDWNLALQDRWYLKWGFDLKEFTADYDYFHTKRQSEWINWYTERIWTDTTRVAIEPTGRTLGAYFSNRFRFQSNVTTEIGLRFDYNSYTKDKLISPRFNLVLNLGEHTFLRSGWGYYYQSEGIHEIKVEEGENSFYPAELTKQWGLGFEHLFNNGVHLRIEGYYKFKSDLQPDYRNWSNDIEIFQEVQDDRYQINIDNSTAKGIELYLKYDQGGKFTWWTSYALSFVNDEISSLIYQDQENVGGTGSYVGKNDQRHTFYFDFNYRPNRKWHFNLAWQYHSGWPYTPMLIHRAQSPYGYYYYSNWGEYNSAVYPDYHRLDIRMDRHFYSSFGCVTAYIALINVYDRVNIRNYSYSWQNDSSGAPLLVAEEGHWFPLLPSIGIRWSWGH